MFSVGTGIQTCEPPASARSQSPASRSRIGELDGDAATRRRRRRRCSSGPIRSSRLAIRPDDDVRDQPGDRLRAERRQRAPAAPRAAARAPSSVCSGWSCWSSVERLADDEPALDGDRVAAVQVGALAEHDRRCGARTSAGSSAQPASASASWATCSASHWSGSPPTDDRRDAVGERVERRQRAEVAAALAVRPVGVARSPGRSRRRGPTPPAAGR